MMLLAVLANVAAASHVSIETPTFLGWEGRSIFISIVSDGNERGIGLFNIQPENHEPSVIYLKENTYRLPTRERRKASRRKTGIKLGIANNTVFFPDRAKLVVRLSTKDISDSKTGRSSRVYHTSITYTVAEEESSTILDRVTTNAVYTGSYKHLSVVEAYLSPDGDTVCVILNRTGYHEKVSLFLFDRRKRTLLHQRVLGPDEIHLGARFRYRDGYRERSPREP
ncbi:MAG: hypothetical protein AAF492_02810 [Verrucomicrobiota bacterium]